MSLESKIENCFQAKMSRANSVVDSDNNFPGDHLQNNDPLSSKSLRETVIEEDDADDESSQMQEDSDGQDDGFIDALKKHRADIRVQEKL